MDFGKAALDQASKNTISIEQAKMVGSDLSSYITYVGAGAAGGVISSDKTTITITGGQTGYQSYSQANITNLPNKDDLIGQQITFSFLISSSAGFMVTKNLQPNINVNRKGNVVNDVKDSGRRTVISPTLARLEIDYTITSNDTDFRPYLMCFNNTDTSQGNFQIVSVKYTANPATRVVDGGVNNLIISQVKKGLSTLGIPTTTIKKTIQKSGGDFSTIASAFASNTDGNPFKWYEFTLLSDEIFDEMNLSCPPYTRLICNGTNMVWIRGANPPSASDATITAQSTINIDTSSGDYEFINIKVTGRNCRYAIHDESSGVVTDKNHTLRNCHIEHYGNQDVIDYRVANTLPAGSVWSVLSPYGYGSSSGIKLVHENCTFKSPTNGWYVHNNTHFTKPNVNRVTNCRVINAGIAEDKKAVVMQSLGSGTRDQVILEGNSLSGAIYIDDNPWIPTDLASQYANHFEYDISGYGNTPVPFINMTRGMALKITSNESVATSKVALSGTAVPVLLGNLLNFDGKGGLKGYCYGSFDVSDIGTSLSANVFVSGMQRRLGNRTSTPVTLTVTFESKVPIDITFAEDYITRDNTYILAQINTALGANGVASIFNPALWERPKLRDERVTYRNMSASGIPRNSAVKRSTIMGGFDIMAYADDISDFLGFLEDDVNPNETGTIKKLGYMGANDVIKDGTVNFAHGNMIGISTTIPGKIINTADATKRIGYGVSSMFFRFNC